MTQTTISDHWIPLEEGRIFARRWRPAQVSAEAPTILMLHDSLGSVDLWRDLPARLAETTGLPVLAYDRLGFGRSDPNPRRPTRGFMAEEARVALPALREALGFGRFVAFGHSAGGGMAVAAGAAFPEACAGIVTLAAQAFAEPRTLEGIREARLRFADPEQQARLARHHGEKAPWALSAWIDTWLSPDFADWTLEDQLRRVRAPLLAIHGDRDEYGSPEHLERIRTQAGGPVSALLIEDCGHLPHREHTERVLTATRSHLLG